MSGEGTYPKPSRSSGNTGSLGRLLLLRRNMTMFESWVSLVAVVFREWMKGRRRREEVLCVVVTLSSQLMRMHKPEWEVNKEDELLSFIHRQQ